MSVLKGAPGERSFRISPARGVAVVLFALLFRVAAGAAQSRSEIAVALHVDVAQRAPTHAVADGFVTNDSQYQLAGGPLEPTFGWVAGDLAGRGGRGWFRVPVPPRAVTFTISEVSFDLVAPENPQAP